MSVATDSEEKRFERLAALLRENGCTAHAAREEEFARRPIWKIKTRRIGKNDDGTDGTNRVAPPEM